MLGPLAIIFGRSWIWLFICWQKWNLLETYSSLTRCLWKFYQTNKYLDIFWVFNLCDNTPFHSNSWRMINTTSPSTFPSNISWTWRKIWSFTSCCLWEPMRDVCVLTRLASLTWPCFHISTTTTKLRLNSNTSSSLTTVTYVYTILPQRGLKAMLTAQILCAWRNLQLVYETNDLIC